MSNKQTKGDYILDSLDPKRFLRELKTLNKQPRKGHRCDDCGHYYDEGDIFKFDDAYLCVCCADDRDTIREEEKKFHHKGGL